MNYTALPSIKGQITIPVPIRTKYNIGKDTPVIIEDQGKGVITVKVMKMIDHKDIEYYENAKKVGLKFKNGVDPEIIAKAIKQANG
ncbi:MAG: hypothetical protein UT33_C0010G0024 [Candidatus Peregrinibacteria bacterium GW2011_GWC2_39_14]|nr:MAG: hypothetical protein US92_C0006G0024 [Candidatus Peregrinibacteria bacterium GW2011_GWA2_38_36]KKR05881.1 MAG: hypothetical protein UT33_C0010G0024 [Candidatus Peregrinibacteria bacterium GW2011_GWC2_39_14]